MANANEFPLDPVNGALAELEKEDGSTVIYKYDAANGAWKIVGVNGGTSEYITTVDVQTTVDPPAKPTGYEGLDSTQDIGYLTNQKLVNWYFAEEIINNKQLIEELVWIGDNSPALGINGEQLYTFWFDTTILELFIWHNGAWFPTSIPPTDYGLEIEQFQYEVNRLQALLDELYLFTQTTNERLDGIDNDIIELEEEIEALAPSLERGQWDYKQILENRAYTLFDGSGQPTDMFNNVASIYVSTIDADGTPHGFDDVVAGSYVEIFNDTDADFGLYVVKDVDDKSNMNPGYWIFTVDFIKSNRLPSRANGLARFKFFEAPTGGDISELAPPTPAYIRTGPLSLDTPVDNSNLNVSPDRKTLVVRNRTDSIDNNTNFYISDTRYLRVSKDAFEAAFPGGIENYTFMPGQMVYYAADHRQTAASLPMNMGAFLAISWKYHPDRWYEIEVSGSATNNHHYKYPQNKYIEDSIYDHFLSFGCFWRNS